MKKKLFLTLALVLLACCLFALSISAANTNEFGNVETSNTIDLNGMSTDTNARVVLFDGTEYHTYPAQYIVTSATDITFNFEKINTAFTKSYVNNSVIRIEIPNTVRVIDSGEFNYGKNNNLKEVFFPSDSQVYKLNWGCFEKNTGLEKINIPASITEYHGTNHFCGCTALKEVTFSEGYSLSYIPNNFFSGCSSLERIVFPNCVTSIGGGAFGSCSKLKTIVLGSSLQTMSASMSDCATGGSVWYLPASFYGSSVTSEPPSNMFHWAGTQTNGTSGNNNNPKNITFVYTGTRAEAEALQARFKAADAATGENCVGLKRIWDATLCTEAEYKELTGKNVGEVGAGYYIVYGYNACDAFYNGEHSTSQINPCVVECSVCKDKIVNHISEYESVTVKYANGYDNVGEKITACTNEGCNHSATEEVPALFECLGFSAPENGVCAITLGYKLNRSAVDSYAELAKVRVDYGIFVVAKKNLGANDVVDANGTFANGVIGTSMKARKFSYYDIKIVGIETDAHKSAEIAMGTYVIVTGENGAEISYIQNSDPEEGAKYSFVSYNSVTNA